MSGTRWRRKLESIPVRTFDGNNVARAVRYLLTGCRVTAGLAASKDDRCPDTEKECI